MHLNVTKPGACSRLLFRLAATELWGSFKAHPYPARSSLETCFHPPCCYISILVFRSFFFFAPTFNLCSLVIYVYPHRHLKSFPAVLGRNHKYQFYLHPESGGGCISVTANLVNPYPVRQECSDCLEQGSGGLGFSLQAQGWAVRKGLMEKI